MKNLNLNSIFKTMHKEQEKMVSKLPAKEENKDKDSSTIINELNEKLDSCNFICNKKENK